MRFALSLVTSSLLVFGALAFTAEPADAKGFSFKRLKKTKRYKQIVDQCQLEWV